SFMIISSLLAVDERHVRGIDQTRRLGESKSKISILAQSRGRPAVFDQAGSRKIAPGSLNERRLRRRRGRIRSSRDRRRASSARAERPGLHHRGYTPPWL